MLPIAPAAGPSALPQPTGPVVPSSESEGPSGSVAESLESHPPTAHVTTFFATNSPLSTASAPAGPVQPLSLFGAQLSLSQPPRAKKYDHHAACPVCLWDPPRSNLADHLRRTVCGTKITPEQLDGIGMERCGTCETVVAIGQGMTVHRKRCPPKVTLSFPPLHPL